MDDLGGQKPSYFWRDGPLKNFFVEAMVPVPPPAEAGSVAEEGRCLVEWPFRLDARPWGLIFFFKGLQSWHEGFCFFLDFRWNEASEIKATSDRLVTSDVKAEILYGFVGYNARLTQFTGVNSGGSAKRHEPHLTIAWYLTGRFSCPSNQTEISPKPIWGWNKKTWFARMHFSLVEFFVPSLKSRILFINVFFFQPSNSSGFWRVLAFASKNLCPGLVSHKPRLLLYHEKQSWYLGISVQMLWFF